MRTFLYKAIVIVTILGLATAVVTVMVDRLAAALVAVIVEALRLVALLTATDLSIHC